MSESNKEEINQIKNSDAYCSCTDFGAFSCCHIKYQGKCGYVSDSTLNTT